MESIASAATGASRLQGGLHCHRWALSAARRFPRTCTAGWALPGEPPPSPRAPGGCGGRPVSHVLARRVGGAARRAVASMSLATDLGLGQPMEHVLRSCVLGLRIAEDLELDESERAVVYYVALLAWLGCHADAHEQSAWFGDDIELRADKHLADSVGARFMLSHVGRGEPPPRRARRLGSLLVSGRDALAAMETTHCLVAGLFAMRLGLGTEVRDGLQHVFERWDGKGTPAGSRATEIALSARIVVVADMVESFRRLGGMAGGGRRGAPPRGRAVRPSVGGARAARTRTRCSAGSTRRRGGTPRSPPSRRSHADVRRRAGLRARGDRGLRRPQVAVYDRALARGRRARGVRRAAGGAGRAGRGRAAARRPAA